MIHSLFLPIGAEEIQVTRIGRECAVRMNASDFLLPLCFDWGQRSAGEAHVSLCALEVPRLT